MYTINYFLPYPFLDDVTSDFCGLLMCKAYVCIFMHGLCMNVEEHAWRNGRCGEELKIEGKQIFTKCCNISNSSSTTGIASGTIGPIYPTPFFELPISVDLFCVRDFPRNIIVNIKSTSISSEDLSYTTF